MDLQLRPNIAKRGLDGQMDLDVLCRDAEAREWSLDAVDLEITNVEGVDGHELSWRYDGDRIHLRWATPGRRGETRRLRVMWSVWAPLTGLVGPSGDVSGDAALFMATDHETHRARYWLPCIDHPSVRPRIDFALTVPAGHRALANGAWVGTDTHDDGSQTVRWSLDQGAPSYLTCFVTGALVEANGGEHHTADGRVVPIAFFAPAPFTAEDLSRAFGPTREMLDWMTSRLDSTYPYAKYYQFAVPGIGGAMENISLVSWDDAWVPDARLHAELGWLVDIINLHEMAHTWFGDVVVCRDHTHAWLKESWATYMESVWLGDTRGTDDMHAQLADDRAAYLSEADGRYIRPIATRYFESAWDMYDRHLYPGGAVRLHLLRTELGEDAFWRGVRAYLARYRGRVVETDDFRREMEEASGRSLASFFDQWFRSPGYPRLRASWSQTGDTGTLTLHQDAWPKDSGVPVFTFGVTVAVETAAGAWIRQTGRMKGDRLDISVGGLSGDVLQVVVDPDSCLPARIQLELGADLLRRAVQHAPTVRGRIDAAAALAKKGRPSHIQAIADAYRAEPMWQVRTHLSRALGTVGSVAAADALGALLPFETDPKAQQSLLDACGSVRSPALAQAILAWLDGPERPYRASGSAWTALGKQRDAQYEARLVAASEDAGWWGWVARGAVSGLGELRTPGAVAQLQKLATATNTRRPVRVLAAEALGSAARWLPREGREAQVDVLVQLTHDADYGVRSAAARGLVALGEAAGASAIECLAVSGVSLQDRPRTEKLAQRLRQGGTVSGLEQQLEALRDELRGLRTRLDEAEREKHAPKS